LNKKLVFLKAKCLVQKLDLFFSLKESKALIPQPPLLRGELKGGLKKWGIYGGVSPRPEIRVSKAKGLNKGRVG